MADVIYKKEVVNRLDYLMSRLQLSSIRLANISGVDHSLITKWRRGDRKLTPRSKCLRPIASALLSIDEDSVLKTLASPYRIEGDSDEAALAMYLTSEEAPIMRLSSGPPERQLSGHYTVTHHVYLGRKGLCNALLAMLDYVQTLPEGQEIVLLSDGNYNWVMQDIAFALHLLERLKKAFSIGTKLTVMSKKGSYFMDGAMFAGPLTAAHLSDNIKSLYYEGEMPQGERLIISIKGYWSLHMHEDPEVEDKLFTSMHTDPIGIKQAADVCDAFKKKAHLVSRCCAFSRIGPVDPARDYRAMFAIQRTPGLGCIRRDEYTEIAGKPPVLGHKLFQADGGFRDVPTRLVFCLDDLRESLVKERKLNKALSELLGRRAYVPVNTARRQISRMLEAMRENDDFEVALVPRVAYDKIGLEMLALRGCALITWWDSSANAGYTEIDAIIEMLYGFGEFVWDRLLAGWKRRGSSMRLLKRWLQNEELDGPLRETSMMRNWSLYGHD